MKQGKVIIRDESGLHLRPAKELCKTAVEYKCSIKLRKDNAEVNAKSIISLLSACVKMGNEIEVICDGEDEDEAFDAIMEILRQKTL